MSGSKAEAVFERPVPYLGRSALLAILVTVVLMVAWEAWVRSEGVEPAYRNSDSQWVEQRRRINKGAGDGWVFTGSSRVLFNMQLSVWERLDTRRPCTTGAGRNRPVAVLEGLADDDDFTGKLIVGVAPGFSFPVMSTADQPLTAIRKSHPPSGLATRFPFWQSPISPSTNMTSPSRPYCAVSQYLPAMVLCLILMSANSQIWNATGIPVVGQAGL